MILLSVTCCIYFQYHNFITDNQLTQVAENLVLVDVKLSRILSPEVVVARPRIRKHREEAGDTRERFAEKLDVRVSYLDELERGRTGVSVKNLIAICNLLGLSADYVLFAADRGGDAALLDKLHRIDEKYVPLLDSVLDQLLALNADTTE